MQLGTAWWSSRSTKKNDDNVIAQGQLKIRQTHIGIWTLKVPSKNLQTWLQLPFCWNVCLGFRLFGGFAPSYCDRIDGLASLRWTCSQLSLKRSANGREVLNCLAVCSFLVWALGFCNLVGDFEGDVRCQLLMNYLLKVMAFRSMATKHSTSNARSHNKCRTVSIHAPGLRFSITPWRR